MPLTGPGRAIALAACLAMPGMAAAQSANQPPMAGQGAAHPEGTVSRSPSSSGPATGAPVGDGTTPADLERQRQDQKATEICKGC